MDIRLCQASVTENPINGFGVEQKDLLEEQVIGLSRAPVPAPAARIRLRDGKAIL